MASVKLFPSSPYWYACYKLPSKGINTKGRRVFRRTQKSTRTEDKLKALQLALAYEKAAKLASQKEWTDTSAQDFLHEIAAISGVKVSQIEKVDDFLKKWLAGRVRLTSESTQLNEKAIVDDFLEHLGEGRRSGPMANITPTVVGDFRTSELDKGKSRATVNKALSILGQAFEEAVRVMALTQNPAKGLRVNMNNGAAQERLPFSFDQFASLVRRTGPGEKSRRGNSVSPEWQTAIVIGGYTGGRQQEVMQITWGQIDLVKGTIALRRAKNGHDLHLMPLHPSLKKHLLSLPGARDPSALVLPGLASLPGRSVSKAFRETILPRVGISQPYSEKTDAKGVGRKIAPYSFHSLRHALASWMSDAGIDEGMRMRIIGHEDADVHRTYTHSELSQLSATISKVPKLP